MRLSRRCRINNVYLDEIDESIVIRSMDPGTPAEDVGSSPYMGGWGSRITNRHWNQLEASVTFAINIPKRQLSRRRAVFDKVIAWAQEKRFLYFNTQPGKRLYIDHVIYPGAGDLWDWTAEYTIGFRAYGVPFWEDVSPAEWSKQTVATSNGAACVIAAEVEGTAPGTLDVSFKNISGRQINDVKIRLGTATPLTMNGVNLAANETLVMSHTRGGLLKITAESGTGDSKVTRNVYGQLTGGDDLYVNPGAVNVRVDASRAGVLTVSSYARWL